MSRQEKPTQSQFKKEFKALMLSFDCKLTSKKGNKKVMVEFTMDGVTSLDLSDV